MMVTHNEFYEWLKAFPHIENSEKPTLPFVFYRNGVSDFPIETNSLFWRNDNFEVALCPWVSREKSTSDKFFIYFYQLNKGVSMEFLTLNHLYRLFNSLAKSSILELKTAINEWENCDG